MPQAPTPAPAPIPYTAATPLNFDPNAAARQAQEAARLAQEAAAMAQQLSQIQPGDQIDASTWQAIDRMNQAAAQGQQLASEMRQTKEEADRELDALQDQLATRQREIDLRQRELDLEAKEAEIRRREEAMREQARAAATPQGQASRPSPSQAAQPTPTAQPAPTAQTIPTQPTPAPQPAQQTPAPDDRPPQYREHVTVRADNGRGLFYVTLPTTWRVSKTSLVDNGTSSRPYIPSVSFENDGSGLLFLRLGDAGTRQSDGMKALTTQYGMAFAGSDTANYAPVPSPRRTLESYVRSLVPDDGLPSLTLLQEIGSTRASELQKDAERRFQQMARASGGAIVRDPLGGEIIRIYAFQLKGNPQRIAVYLRFYAIKDGSGIEYITPAGLMGNLVGGLIGSAQRAKKRKEATASGAPTSSGPAGWSTPDFDEYIKGGTIYWNVAGLAAAYAPEAQFDKVYREAFLPLISTYDIHEDMTNMAMAVVRQESANIQNATNREINAMNMRHQANMAAARQMQAAADARFESWQRQSDAHHAAFRERTNAQFNGSYGGSSAPDFSEAIRGVNTYTTSDGRQVEVDVRYDRAYENQGGDVMGWDSGFEPGSDWTEIPRA